MKSDKQKVSGVEYVMLQSPNMGQGTQGPGADPLKPSPAPAGWVLGRAGLVHLAKVGKHKPPPRGGNAIQ